MEYSKKQYGTAKKIETTLSKLITAMDVDMLGLRVDPSLKYVSISVPVDCVTYDLLDRISTLVRTRNINVSVYDDGKCHHEGVCYCGGNKGEVVLTCSNVNLEPFMD